MLNPGLARVHSSSESLLESPLMRLTAALVLAAALAACSGREPADKPLPDVRLPTLGGPAGPSLAACPTAKCLTVVVAPWCGVCHAATPEIIKLRRYLDRTGVSSRVVIGQGALADLKEYAAEFGPDALLDE